MASPEPGRRHRVVVIGSGFGGLNAAKYLKRADVDITLISRTTTHLFQPLLYQVATGILSEGEIAPTASRSSGCGKVWAWCFKASTCGAIAPFWKT